MILIENFVEDAVRKAKHLEPGKCLDTRTHKRDRGVMIVKNGETYTVYEDGFYHEVFSQLSLAEMEKLLKKLRKREFPNSRVVHFYEWNSIEEVCHARRY
ncbi:MAG: hypothetical protein Q4G58_05895 [bacterium]|nr:hypothetical protein [bacterium]